MANAVLMLRWVGRVWSLASIGLLGAFLFGEGLPPLTAQTVLFPFGVMFGLALAWRFERVGGLVAALSVGVFYALAYADGGGFPRGPWFFLIAAPGLVFILAGCLRARAASVRVAEPDMVSEA